MNGVQTRFKCKLDVKRCKRFVFPPSSLLPRSNALKTKAIRYFQTDRTLTRIVSPPLQASRRSKATPSMLLYNRREILPHDRLSRSLRTGQCSTRPWMASGYALPVICIYRLTGKDLSRLLKPCVRFSLPRTNY